MIANRVRMSKVKKGETPIESWNGIFADRQVGIVLYTNGLIADANKSSIKELATITSLSDYFKNNKVIRQFPELKYCTGVTNLYYTFYGCSSLTTAPVIPEGVTNLTNTFFGCSSLTTAPVIPEGVTSLYSTFYGCSSLTKAPDIPASVTNLTWTFQGCSRINGIYIINIVIPVSYSNSLSNVQAIYVPDASVSAYKTASGWTRFKDKIFPMSDKPQ